MLQKSLMVDQFIEKMLTKLRYEILFTLVDSNQNILEEHFNFIISLAEQCFLNEYVYVQSKKEINHVNQLKNKIVNKLKEKNINWKISNQFGVQLNHRIRNKWSYNWNKFIDSESVNSNLNCEFILDNYVENLSKIKTNNLIRLGFLASGLLVFWVY